jgi:hypothetical protein
MKGTGKNNTHMSAVSQVQTAGYWIGRDARMAQSVNDNLTLPDFITFSWTEWDEENEKIFHSANYSIEDLSGDTGKLKRTHWSSAGANETTLIVTNIYYAPADPDATSKASYQPPVLTLQLTSLVEDAMEVREYRIKHRPNI